jgi:hypothetical protein
VLQPVVINITVANTIPVLLKNFFIKSFFK